MIAGATQANVFNGIMTNMSEGAEAVATSLNSSGSATQENARHMDSIQGRLAQLSATFQELSSNVINSAFLHLSSTFGLFKASTIITTNSNRNIIPENIFFLVV